MSEIDPDVIEKLENVRLIAVLQARQAGLSAIKETVGMRAIIDALRADPELAAKALGVEVRPGRWWRVDSPDGSLWCGTSSEREARQALLPEGTLWQEHRWEVVYSKQVTQ